ncbi:MAG: polyprenol monophosphomannose synthase [Candidatus Altiarchaeota archaeon]|nr:polyprenol monophosphomannose synthase [Candidatus Altiarchaeota archaeon]
MMKATLVIPTYNEAGNMARIVEKVMAISEEKRLDLEVVIVDDNSPDGTGDKAEKLAEKYSGKIRVIHREGKEGLSSAIAAGFTYAANDIVGVTDADMSHELERMPEMINAITGGEAELVIGSRYVSGGGIDNWGLKRRIISKTAVLLARPLTGIKDPVSGFFFFDKKIIEGVELNSSGYKLLLEIIVKGRYGKAVEIPYHFTDRKIGRSKLDLNEFRCYLKTLYMLYRYRYGF